LRKNGFDTPYDVHYWGNSDKTRPYDSYDYIAGRVMRHEKAYEKFIPNPIIQTDCCERCERTVPARLVNDDGICATCRISEQENILELA
jgi:hypothetical protein